ncbi:MAG: complex I subunit 4 family protein [Saprospiraceae bacterium]
MLTTFLIILPFLGAIASAAAGAYASRVALFSSIAELILAIFAYNVYIMNPSDNLLTAQVMWSNSLGSNFHVSMDGISMLMVLLTSLITPFIVFSAYSKPYGSSKSFFALVLAMQAALVGVFTAMDGLIFYVFWELALIPIWFICLIWGAEGRQRITFKFFIYTLAGSLFMLAALIYLYSKAGNTFDIHALYSAGNQLSAWEQTIVFWALFLAFAIKMPVFPFHTWQPDTYTNAPTQGTMLLSGIMLKMGTYGLIRWLIPMVPMGVIQNGYIAISLAVISIVYASFIAIAQKDFKRMIAYSSIAHVGLIAAGLMSFNIQGIQGGMVQMLAHGINVVGLFFICDIIFSRMGTAEMNVLGGIRGVAPQFALVFLIVLLGSVALPLTNGFVGEFLLLNGLFQYNFWMAVFGGLTVILGAVYMLRAYQKMMLGETNSRTLGFTDLTKNEKWVLIPICILIIVMGVYPKPILDLTEPSVKALIDGVSSGWTVK